MILLSFSLATIGAVLASMASSSAMFILAISLVYVNTTIYHPARARAQPLSSMMRSNL